MISHQALSELHVIPQGQTINGEYYRTKILAGSCKDAINRRTKNGSVLQRAMTSKMSEIIFRQDGAPAHTAKLTQEWCKQNLPAFWQKASGLETHLTSIPLKLMVNTERQVEEFEQVSTVNNVVKNLEKAWSGISDVLQNMASSMP
ncbi:hypothetical protein LOD99_10964, partial [Oopsacas minuta]